MYNKQFSTQYTHNNIINSNFIIEYFTDKKVVNIEYLSTDKQQLKRFTTAKKTFTTEEKQVIKLIINDLKNTLKK